MFQARDLNRLYRLPLTFPELAVTGTRFHIKPLFRLLQGDGRFFLLALDLHGARLFQGTRYQLEVAGLPASVPDAMQSDRPQANRQQAAQSTPGRGAPRAGSSQLPGPDACATLLHW